MKKQLWTGEKGVLFRDRVRCTEMPDSVAGPLDWIFMEALPVCWFKNSKVQAPVIDLGQLKPDVVASYCYKPKTGFNERSDYCATPVYFSYRPSTVLHSDA